MINDLGGAADQGEKVMKRRTGAAIVLVASLMAAAGAHAQQPATPATPGQNPLDVVPEKMPFNKPYGTPISLQKAEEAIHFYASVFHNSKVGDIMRYTKGQEPDKEGTIKHVDFTLEGQDFAAMDSAREHKFNFNEAISFMVHCDTQKEIDYYWDKLSADPKAEQCGWLKDKYGLSWQVVPTMMNEMFQKKDKEKIARVTEAFLKMKKFDIETLQRAAEGKK